MLAAAAAWGAALFQFYFRDAPATFFFSSDYVTFETIYRDLFVDGYPWSGWSPPPAPEYFPSMLAYFVVRALSSNFLVAELAFLILKQAALIAAILVLAYVILRRLDAGTIALTFLCATFPLLYVGKVASASFDFSPLLVTPQGHYGTALCSIFLLALFLHWLRRPGWKPLAGLFILAALVAGSDVFIGPFFVGPALVVCLVMYLARALVGEQALKLIAVLVLAMIVGRSIGQAITPYSILDHYLATSPTKAAASLHIFVADQLKSIETGNALSYLLIFYGLGCVGWLAAVVWRRRDLQSVPIPVRRQAAHRGITILVAFWLLATFMCLGSILFFGVYEVAEDIRYLLISVILSLFGWPIVVAYTCLGRSAQLRSVAAASVVTVAILLGATWNDKPMAQTILSFYPESIRCLDALAAKYDLRFGLAGYWSAKYYTVLSHANLRIYQLSPQGEILHLDNNIGWYLGSPGSEPRYTFLLQDPDNGIELDLRYIRDRYGPPALVEKCDAMNVWIYTGDNQKFLRSLVHDSLSMVGGSNLLRKVGDKIAISARALPSQTGKPDGRSRVAEPTDPPGALIYGPYFHLQAGRYLFELEYELDADPQAPPSNWDVYIGMRTILAQGTLDPGARFVRATIDVPKALDGIAVEMRAWYRGGGRLTVHGITIERLR